MTTQQHNYGNGSSVAYKKEMKWIFHLLSLKLSNVDRPSTHNQKNLSSNKNFLRAACCTDLAYPIKSSFQFKRKTSFCFPMKAPVFQQKCFLRLSCLKERIIQPNLKNPRVVQLPGKQKISNTCLGNYFFFYFHEKIKSLYFSCVSNTGILYFSKI